MKCLSYACVNSYFNYFFSVRERAVFYKFCNLIGSESGKYSPHPARSQRAVSDPLRDEIKKCFEFFFEAF